MGWDKKSGVDKVAGKVMWLKKAGKPGQGRTGQDNNDDDR